MICIICNNEGLIETSQIGAENSSECTIEKCDNCNVFRTDAEAMGAWVERKNILDLF